MTLRHMKIFVTVCQFSSITAAAENLYLAQPAVSLAVKELEDYYGIKLFDRISRRLYITEAGKQLLNYASHITSLFDEMEKSMKNWDSIGALRIGSGITIGTYLIPYFVKEFSQQFPNINVYVTIDSSEKIEERLLTNDLDFALIEASSRSPYIISEPFADDLMVVVCGLEHPFAKKGRITLDDLKPQRLLLREKGSSTRDFLDNMLMAHGISISPAWESISTRAIINAVINNLGISVLPYHLIKRELDEGRIKTVEVSKVKFKRKFYIVYHQHKFLTKSAQAFIDLAKNSEQTKAITAD